ncbi:Aste57867_25221 [Aphanomyces stellatus]|uniref:glucan endo-1,3-beta-D-glucosidase n=1 Tax=Aphanomyces stellatus TaxID=120398 RepID=A0A485LX57_9STRA|nr:hypothetical protein As57867_025143 [Aphanomyces stellatus]VFU01848.1 Aste57867_25221 [Aphanomyces stellatus]
MWLARVLTLWFLAPSVHGQGVVYEPVAAPTVTAASVRADLPSIHAHGFTFVRTLRSLYGAVDVGPLLAQAGFQLALGIPYPAADVDAQTKAALATANKSAVPFLFLGSEITSAPSDLVTRLKQLKRAAPPQTKVGTVLRVADVMHPSPNLVALLDECDVVGVTIYPSRNTTAAAALAQLKRKWTDAMAAPHVAGKLLLAGTGWSSDIASLDSVNAFVAGYKAWSAMSRDRRYLFEMFESSLHPHMGLAHANRTSKLTSGVRTQATASQPTTAPPMLVGPQAASANASKSPAPPSDGTEWIGVGITVAVSGVAISAGLVLRRWSHRRYEVAAAGTALVDVDVTRVTCSDGVDTRPAASPHRVPAAPELSPLSDFSSVRSEASSRLSF